jgi:hypothetical protein
VQTARRMGMLGIALFAVGCSSNATAPTNGPATLNQDVATISADAAGQDIEFMRGPGGRFGLGLRADPGSFDCTSVQRDGLTITRTCTFYDQDGNVQDAYDTLTTDSAQVHVEVSGSIDRGDWGSSSVSRVRDITVTGLLGTETSLTWNGTGSGTMSKVHQAADGSTVQMDVTSSQTAKDVVIPVPRTSTSWPLGGTITSSVSVTFTGGPNDGETHTRDVTITFDGTQYATVTVNGQTFTVDLASRQCHEGGRDSGGQRFWGRHK